MKKNHISKLFNLEGMILENNNSLEVSEVNIEEIKSTFKKYGIIVFSGFDFTPKKLTSFTGIFTGTLTLFSRTTFNSGMLLYNKSKNIFLSLGFK